MKQRVVVVLLALLFVGCMSTAAFALTAAADGDGKSDKGNHGKGHEKGAKSEKDRGHAPPWAHRDDREPDRAWKDAWKDMTPAERADLMAELAQEHADGMKDWAACVQDAGDDADARAKCERPLPPGLAKKQAR